MPNPLLNADRSAVAAVFKFPGWFFLASSFLKFIVLINSFYNFKVVLFCCTQVMGGGLAATPLGIYK